MESSGFASSLYDMGFNLHFLIDKNQRQDSRSLGHEPVHFHRGCQEAACGVTLMPSQDPVRRAVSGITLGLAGSALLAGTVGYTYGEAEVALELHLHVTLLACT